MSDYFLTASQVEEFFDRGFIVLEDVFTLEEVSRVKEAMNRLYERSREFTRTHVHDGSQFVYSGENLHRVVWAGANEPYLLGIGEDPRITHRVSQLLGASEIEQLINQCHFKMPHDNVAFRFHQDSENRGYGTEAWKDLNGKGSYVQTVVSIDPMTEENGPLVFYPYSSGHGHIGLDRGANLDDYVDHSEAVSLTLKPGSLALFGPYTIHGSLPNESESPRFVLINGYAYPGANRKEYPGDSVRSLKVF